MLRHLIAALTFAVGLGIIVICGAQAQNQITPASSATAPAKNDYSKPESWLCRPGRKDACAVDLTTTIVAADGKLTRETWAADLVLL
jgi:hypothetical protein